VVGAWKGLEQRLARGVVGEIEDSTRMGKK